VSKETHAGILLGLFYPEDGGDISLRNVDDLYRITGRYIPIDRTLYACMISVLIKTGRALQGSVTSSNLKFRNHAPNVCHLNTRPG
jgi:hypothetical protein